MILKYEGTLTCLTPIHHGGNEKTGSTPTLRTVMLYDEVTNCEIPIPYINGNAIRGKARRQVMHDFIVRLGMDVSELPRKLYYILFSGGLLESTSEASFVDLDLRRKIRYLLPPLSIFGCTIGNQMIQGKLKIGHAFPICREYLPYLPDYLRKDPRATKSIRSFTDECFDTRKDDLRAEREEGEQALQMRVEFETFIPGTKFYHWIALEYPTQVEKSCLGQMVRLWKDVPIVGGKSSSGYGQVSIQYYPDLPNHEHYIDFVESHQDDIKDILMDIGAKL